MPVQDFIRRLLAAFAVPLVALALGIVGFEIERERRLVRDDLEAATLAVARDIDTKLARRLHALVQLAASPELAREAGPRREGFRRDAQFFREIFDSHAIVADMGRRMVLHTRVPEG